MSPLSDIDAQHAEVPQEEHDERRFPVYYYYKGTMHEGPVLDPQNLSSGIQSFLEMMANGVDGTGGHDAITEISISTHVGSDVPRNGDV